MSNVKVSLKDQLKVLTYNVNKQLTELDILTMKFAIQASLKSTKGSVEAFDNLVECAKEFEGSENLIADALQCELVSNLIKYNNQK